VEQPEEPPENVQGTSAFMTVPNMCSPPDVAQVQASVTEKCNGYGKCKVSSTDIFNGIESCPGMYKYLAVDYKCIKTNCVHPLKIQCPKSTVINMLSASYETQEGPHCLHVYNTDTDDDGSLAVMEKNCNGNEKCSVSGDRDDGLFGFPKHAPYKHLTVDYECTCTKDSVPVCAGGKPYDNYCKAKADGVQSSAIVNGECKENENDCRAIYDATDAMVSIKGGPTIKSNHVGYWSKGGYAAFTGDYMEWAIKESCSTSVALTIRYALKGGANRPLLSVDGKEGINMDFPNTRSWTTWETTTINAEIDTTGGSHVVRLTGASGANIDRLIVQGREPEE